MLQMKDQQELRDVGIQIDEMWSFVGNKRHGYGLLMINGINR
jgi:hypothetical protein